MDIAMIGLIFSVVATLIIGGCVILYGITSQLSAFRLELGNKIETRGNRLGGRIQQSEDRMERRMQQFGGRMEGRMQQFGDRMERRMQRLEDGQIDLGRRLARLEGMLICRLSSGEPLPARPGRLASPPRDGDGPNSTRAVPVRG